MKKSNFILGLLLITTVTCKSQNILDLNVWQYINRDYVRASSANSGQHEMTIPYYELYADDNKKGEGCLFALAKTYPESWRGNRDDACEEKPSDRAKDLCNLRTMFGEDTSRLLAQMDLYLFFVDWEDLQEPFVEEAEGGLINNYYPRPGSTYVVYHYQNGQWQEIDRLQSEGEEIPRSAGMPYMERMAEERIQQYLRKH